MNKNNVLRNLIMSLRAAGPPTVIGERNGKVQSVGAQAPC